MKEEGQINSLEVIQVLKEIQVKIEFSQHFCFEIMIRLKFIT